ncbi:MAG TPA: TetR family transcriptional regulator [Acidimicrobiales bacterium]|nr:TetR family transcriptional regulator [Acidimicrobiales bacterium]
MSLVAGVAFEDLTAKARIRDAAVRLFAERGTEATTVREIASAAGVSGGLVRHHFGAKEDLRAACDSYVLAEMMRFKEQVLLRGQVADAGFLSAAQPTVLVMLRYFARSTLDGSPSADAMFSEMVALARQWVEDHHPIGVPDPQAYAALLIAMEMGALVMRRQLSHALGADILQPEGHLRLARARLELYSKPLLSPELVARAVAAIDQLQIGTVPGAQRAPSATSKSKATAARRGRR